MLVAVQIIAVEVDDWPEFAAAATTEEAQDLDWKLACSDYQFAAADPKLALLVASADIVLANVAAAVMVAAELTAAAVMVLVE